MIDQPMHLRLKKGMLVRLKNNQTFDYLYKNNQNLTTAITISDVYVLKNMFHMIDIIIQGKKKRVRTTWVREIIYE